MLRSRETSVRAIIEGCYEQIEKRANLNSFISVANQEEVFKLAEQAQERYDQGQELSQIDGLPIAVKDNILVKGMDCTAASAILKGFKPPVDATVVKRLKEKGAIVIGKANMDEFGMGSLGMYGYDDKKVVRNPLNEEYFSGGSSAGSAAAVKASQSLASLGTDTGGSVIYPAHCCGLYSIKPSYGRLSRYGQILYASSNDVIGPMTRSAQDLQTIFGNLFILFHQYYADIAQGEDINDSNCIDFTKINKIRYHERTQSKIQDPFSLKKVKVGVVQEFDIEELDDRNRNLQEQMIRILKDQGAEIVNVSMPLVKYCLPFYFNLIPAEASSNLARYDGLKYGYQPDFQSTEAQKKQDLFDYIERARSEAFGLNVKRRVLLGNFLLSSRFEDFNEKVIEAQKVRRLLIEQYCEVFEKQDLDFIISPVSIGEEPPKISDIINEIEKKNPVYEYKMDYYTALPNSTGTPAITIPIQEDNTKYKFPTSIKIQGYFGEDYHLLRIANEIEKLLHDNRLAEI